jgi:major membrane immunogen (membrane-anchored lipoprotein)
MMRKSLMPVALATAAIGAMLFLSGCASAAAPTSTASFIVGTWKCKIYQGGTYQNRGQYLVVNKSGTIQNLQFQDGKMSTEKLGYQYRVTGGNIATTDGLGGGWAMVVPKSVAGGSKYLVKIDSINGGGTHEKPTVTVKDSSHVTVTNLYQSTYECVKTADK